jgi:hypothetical protein
MADRRFIGPAGTIARVVAGAVLVSVAVLSPGWWATDEPLWFDVFLGLGLFPAVMTAAQWARTIFTSERRNATEGMAFCLNIALGAGLFALDYTRDAAALFYGSGMLLAAVRGYAGCEVLAISNWLLRRDDQVGCMIFSPIDELEERLSGQRQRHARQ